MHNNPTSIKFADDLIPLIKNGSKVLTYRLGNKYDFLSVGDEIDIADNEGVVFAKVRIIEKTHTTFENYLLIGLGMRPMRLKKKK